MSDHIDSRDEMDMGATKRHKTDKTGTKDIFIVDKVSQPIRSKILS